MTTVVAASVESDTFTSLLQKIEREHRVPCSGYKDKCLRRRIGVRMRANSIHTVEEYSTLLDRSPLEWEKLLEALTINVTRFFRDTAAFDALEQTAYPWLQQTFAEPLQVWSAGCSHGQEAYSLAMGLAESVGLPGFRIDATDVDAASLAATRSARYSDLALPDIPDARRVRWLAPGPSGNMRDELRARVNVIRHDLLGDPVPEMGYHLITCRNVIIYFSRTAQSELFEKLYAALKPGGILMLGKVETLVGVARDRFEPLNLRERLFRRPLS